MELDSSSGGKPEGSSSSRSLPLDIDLNAMPICSPCERDALAGEGRDKGKGKAVLFDINAEAAADGEEDTDEWLSSGVHALWETSTANSLDGSVTCSNLLLVGSQFDLMKSSGSATDMARLHPVDIVQQRLNSGRNLKQGGPHQTSDFAACTASFQGLSEKLLQSLREFVFNNHGMLLQDGWRVEFFYCQSRCKTIAVYCSPEGNKFESIVDCI